MNKRNVRPQTRTFVSGAPLDEPANSQRMLQNIQQKLDGSAALNGGFDKLLYKIDSIENNQKFIANKVEKIHEAIYDPDEGLFSRISSNKASQNESISEVEKQMVELHTWSDQQKKQSEELEKHNSVFSEKIQKIQSSIETLDRFKTTTMGVTKWVAAAAGGGIVTILFKVIYDFVILK